MGVSFYPTTPQVECRKSITFSGTQERDLARRLAYRPLKL